MGRANLLDLKEKQLSFDVLYLNAGIYMLAQKMLYEIPFGVEISLERELFLAGCGNVSTLGDSSVQAGV